MRVSSVWAGNEATATKTVLFSDRFRIPSLIPRGISCGGSSDDSRYPYTTLVDSLTCIATCRISITSLICHHHLSDKYHTLVFGCCHSCTMNLHKFTLLVIYLLLISFTPFLPTPCLCLGATISAIILPLLRFQL